MALARAWSVALAGLDGSLVEVEADVSAGLPGFSLVGLPDAALTESRDRVRAAIANSGHSWPQGRLTVALSPATMHKRGSWFDLAVASALLAANGSLPASALHRVVLLGELGLDGRIRPVRGILPALLVAADAGIRKVVVPVPNQAEARLAPDVDVLAVASLAQLIAILKGEAAPPAPPEVAAGSHPVADDEIPDMADVVGQLEARRAVEVCAAGGHHLFLCGPPGAGKTMIAERLPGLMPALPTHAALEVTAIHSLAGTLSSERPLITRAPFQAPHHTATIPAIVGGGSGAIRPGAASLAHRGVLFLDEAPEFRAGVLDALRQPLESGRLHIARAKTKASYPAKFLLVLAANPCPCGQAGSAGGSCTCTPHAQRRYLARLSGPLLDRVDIRVQMERVRRGELLASLGDEEPTATIAPRVAEARARAAHRLRGTPWRTNSDITGKALRHRFRPSARALRHLDRPMATGALTARGVDRVLRVAWTLADLAGRPEPGPDEVAEALVLRSGLAEGRAA